MDFMSLAKSRRSIRSYLPKELPPEVITAILEAAQAAPSAGNKQPWHFFVVRDIAVKRRLADAAYGQSFIAAAPVTFVVCADIAQTTPKYGERGRHLYCIQDTAAAIQSMLLCAESLGLGACWCGAFDEEAVSGILGITSADMRPVAVIPLGYYEGKPAPRPRRPLDEIATYI